ncbi:MAG: phosphoserine phosphatase SerB [Idiomarina sp.]|nr:phosphoserine phosphatase SerB [Idiomarina sp.]
MDAPGLAVFDLDSTLVQLESIDAIAALAGCEAEVAAITAAAMRGEIEFTEALQQRVAKLTGIREADILAHSEALPWTPGASQLIQWLKSYRWRIAIVSGGFTWFADEAARKFNADVVVCNQLEVRDGRLTGRLIGPVIDAQAKQNTLIQLRAQYSLPERQVIAVGDGANDIPMIQAAGTGIGFMPKPALRAVADICIDEPDLSLVIAALNSIRVLPDPIDGVAS